jgi:hypothetical protein
MLPPFHKYHDTNIALNFLGGEKNGYSLKGSYLEVEEVDEEDAALLLGLV